MAKKVYISVPQEGRKRSEVFAEQEALLDRVEAEIMRKYKVHTKWLEPYLIDTGALVPLECLGLSLTKLALADFVVWSDGWEDSPWCQIEHTCAEQYGIPTLVLPPEEE